MGHYDALYHSQQDAFGQAQVGSQGLAWRLLDYSQSYVPASHGTGVSMPRLWF